MKYLLTLISTLLLFASCEKKEDDGPVFTKKEASRAVMIYMAGENNLTATGGVRYLKNDLDEIVEGSKQLADDQRVFVFVDSLGTTLNEKGKPYIIEVHGGQTYERKNYSEEFYSCDPDKFRDVISWMTDNIKAKAYGLVLWGHATGWIVENDTIASNRRAYGLDDAKDGGNYLAKWMNITQMASALKTLPKMDFIFADCCNMMGAEVGYELRDVTDYLIGSPAEIPGPGAPYDLILPILFKNGSDLYRGIIDTYFNYYLQAYNESSDPTISFLRGYSVPMAVIDTKYMEQLAQSTRDIVTTFAPEYPQTINVDGIPFYIYVDAPLMFDMKALIKKNATTEAYNAWEQAFNLAVPYHRMSQKWMTIYPELMTSFYYFNASVSMFIPMKLGAYTGGTYKYNATSNHFGWNRVIDWSRFGW